MFAQSLEDRLRVLDLQFVEAGEHLPEERIALLNAGAEPTNREATHLSGCDECVELLVAVGEGLEGLALEDPALAALVLPPPPPPRRRRPYGLIVGGLCFAAAAAAAIGYSRQAATPIAQAPASIPAAPPSAAPISVAAPETTAPAPAPVSIAAPVEPATPATAEEPPAPRPIQVRSVARPRARITAPAIARPVVEPPDARLKLRGPAAVGHRAVSGPPRGYGFLRLGSKPPAKVLVDGKPIGWTPLWNHRLPEGPHRIRLEFDSPLADAKSDEFTVVIKRDQVWRSVRTNLKRQPR